jgi:hypothetical protein
MPKISVCNDSKDLMIVTVVNPMVKLGIVIALGGRKSGTLMNLFYFLSIGVMVITCSMMYIQDKNLIKLYIL